MNQVCDECNDKTHLKEGTIMFKEMKKRVKNEKGLTLIELLAVIVILAIIAAIAIPAIGNIISNSRDKAILSESLNIISGAKIAHMDGECTSNVCSDTVLQSYVDGVTLTGISVELSGNDWIITNEEIANLSNAELKPTAVSGNKYKESDIKAKLDKGASTN